MQLGQLSVGILGVGDEELVDNAVREHLAHDMSEETLDDKPEPLEVKVHRAQPIKERRFACAFVEVCVERVGEGDEGEVGREFGARRGQRRGASLVREGIGSPTIDPSLETAGAVLDCELAAVQSMSQCTPRRLSHNSPRSCLERVPLTSSTVVPPPPDS